MIRSVRRLFIQHPREVGETYGEHFAMAAGFGLTLARLSCIAFIHAVLPGVCKTTVSDEIRRLAEELGQRARVARESRMREAAAFDPKL